MAKKVTMREIARQLNISVSAVSLALNNKPGVNEELRQQVHSLCLQLGYDVEKISGKAEAGGNLGFLIKKYFSQQGGEAYYTRMMHEAQEEAEKRGYHLILNALSQDEIDRGEAPHCLKNNVKGILIAGFVERDYVLSLLRRGIPVVLLGYDLPDVPVDIVKCDNLFGAFTAVNHLIAHGHRRISLVCGLLAHSDSTARLAGYQLALSLARLPLCSEIVLDDLPESSAEVAYEATMKLLKSKAGSIDAFFCVTDNYATGCMAAIKDCGLTVPGDISVVGFDDMYWSAHLSPALTTVRVPTERMGRLGMRRLLDLVDGGGEHLECAPIKLVVPVELVERESAGPARNLAPAR